MAESFLKGANISLAIQLSDCEGLFVDGQVAARLIGTNSQPKNLPIAKNLAVGSYSAKIDTSSLEADVYTVYISVKGEHQGGMSLSFVLLDWGGADA